MYIFVLSQIGGNFFLTAAHCLENWAGEVQEPSELTLYLGVTDKNNLENARWGSDYERAGVRVQS